VADRIQWELYCRSRVYLHGMWRPWQQLKIGMAMLLLGSLLMSLAAPAGAWLCDTGQRCRGSSEHGCCCPEDRKGFTGDAASFCCGETTAVRRSPTACGSPAGNAGRRPGGAHSCCDAATVEHIQPLPRVTALAAAPHCRCHYSFSELSETLVTFDEVRITVIPLNIPVLRALNPPPAPRVPAARPCDPAPPERHLARSPLGSRAPPACLSFC
jgi:hypothetical protein